MAAFTSKLFSEWDDFPNGLKVMVVDRDTTVLAHIQARLEELHYIVATYSCENDALRALSDPACRFHLAIVEAQCEDLEHGSKLIEAAVKLPTVLMSDTENMALMLRGLACGAVEVMTKPLSDYKLRNIWQHVLRKDSAIGKNSALKADQTSMVVAPAEAMVLKEMKMEQRNDEVDTIIDECPTPVNTADVDQEGDHTTPAENDSYSVSDDVAVLDASTEPIDGMNMAGIIMGIRSEMDEECSDLCDQLLALNESRSKGDMSLGELDEVLADPYLLDLSLDVDFPADGDLLSDLSMESSSILDITFDGEVECRDEEALLLAEVARVEKQISGVDTNNVDSGMSSSSSSSSLVNPAPFAMTEGDCNKTPLEHMSTTGEKQNSYNGKKKAKVDWTPELHRRFVQAVEQLGVDNAIPSRILEVMGVQCLTRHNIASHLQKYRSHRRRVQARKTSDARCSSTKKSTPATVPTHANPAASIHQRVFHVWGHPAIHHMQPYVWPTSPGYWQNPTDGTFWQQPHHGLPHPNQGCIDVWGHPAVMPTPAPPGLYPRQTMRMPLAPLRKATNMTVTVPTTSLVETQGCEEAYSGLSLFEEAVTAAIKEAMSNPCAPLPLGLKPPSVDSVVLELQKQGGLIPSLLIHR